jgi:hypothetical protein
MLQVDVRKRPRVEDLEAVQALQSHLLGARNILQDFKFQQVINNIFCMHIFNMKCGLNIACIMHMYL